MQKRWVRQAAPLLVCIATSACSPRLEAPRTGTYRAVLELPGGEAPFELEVGQEQKRYVLVLVNGPERTQVDEVRVHDRELLAVLPGGRGVLRARMYRGRLDGRIEWTAAGGPSASRPGSPLTSPPAGAAQSIPFTAELGRAYRFYQEPSTDNADVSGTWELAYTSDGVTTHGAALLQQSHDRVTGKVIGAGIAHGTLEGQVHGEEVRLSSFDGASVVLYQLRVNDAGDLEGEYWQGLSRHAQVRGRHSAEAADATGGI